MRAFALLFGTFLVWASAAPQAEAGLFDSSPRFSDVNPGTYQAGDAKFSLDRYQNAFLMRWAGQPEIYVLYPRYGSMGTRVLLFDSQATAIQITGWGGMTVYTDDHPEGQPTARVGDNSALVLPAVTPQQTQIAAEDDSTHLAGSRGLKLSFQVDQNTLADNAIRTLAYDTLENAARGIERFTASPAARNAFTQRVASVRIAIDDKPYIKITDKILTVTFNPHTGFFGRASSRAIATALGKMFGIPSN